MQAFLARYFARSQIFNVFRGQRKGVLGTNGLTEVLLLFCLLKTNKPGNITMRIKGKKNIASKLALCNVST